MLVWKLRFFAALTLLAPVRAQEPARAIQVLAAPAPPEQRVALVIGNGAYAAAPLRNPVNDARAMAARLGQCGFEVIALENADRPRMREAVRRFGARIAEGGVGLFYFAGHGMQVKGRNFLVPVGADITQEDEVQGEAVEVDAILAKLESARNRLNIVILDACRNNPFGRSFRSSQQGLAQLDAPTGTFVAFATAPGHTAADGAGANGLYTEALLKQFQTPGLKLEEVFKRTRAEVLKGSQQQQTPWENSSIVGDFYFLPDTGAAPAPAPGAAPPALAGRAPAATPAEVALLEAMRVKGGQAAARQLARPLAAKGSVYGKYALGSLSQDPEIARRAIAEGVRQGIPMAMVDLAESLAESPVSPADLAEARALLEQAAALGEPTAQFQLGAALLEGKLGPRDLPRAERLFTEAAKASTGYFYGAGCVYWMLELDKGEAFISKEEADAKGFAFMRRGADLGDVGAMGMLASAYQYGDHAPRDLQKALSWIKEAASRERDPYWTANVGRFYRDVRDPGYRSGEKAIAWFTRAAERGDAESLGEMAKMYRDGTLVPVDLPRAVGLFRKAAGLGHKSSQSDLAGLYAEGRGVPRDPAQAYFWYLVTGEYGREDQERLAKELPASERARAEARAVAWHRARAEKGSHEDQYALGVHCEAGQGVPASLPTAYFWYLLAGDELPLWVSDRERLARQITAAERTRAESQAAKWKPTKTK